MSLLPAQGTVSYNGVVFDGNTETTELSIVPKLDSAGRTNPFNIYTITLKTRITANAGAGYNTDAQLLTLRQLLLEPGGEFHYENKGMGGLTINLPAGGGKRDVAWGPTPRLLQWKTKGGAAAAEVIWRVEIHIPDCSTAVTQFQLMELCYRLTFDVDKSGYTKRTYSGHYIIPQTRATIATRTLSDSADSDNYRNLINPPVLPGFRRIPGSFVISEDKCRADFTITDEQMPPNALPPGVVDATAEHEVTSTKFTKKWAGRISATYELAYGLDRSLAFKYFLDLLNDRVTGLKQGNPSNAQAFLLTNLTLREPQIYGRESASFSATYTFAVPASVILQASRLFKPVPNSNFQLWATSMAAAKVFSPRGVAGLKFNLSDDAIIDLCQPNQVALTPVALSTFTQPTLSTLPFANSIPAPETSWLAYQCSLLVEQTDQTVELKTLPTQQILTTQVKAPQTQQNVLTAGVNLGNALANAAAAQSGTTFPPPPLSYPGMSMTSITAYGSLANVAQNVAQIRSLPTIAVTLVGEAVRAGFPILAPSLLNIGGSPAILANLPEKGNGFVNGILANWFGVPIVGAKWSLRYLVPQLPTGQIPIPTNPMIG